MLAEVHPLNQSLCNTSTEPKKLEVTQLSLSCSTPCRALVSVAAVFMKLYYAKSQIKSFQFVVNCVILLKWGAVNAGGTLI